MALIRLNIAYDLRLKKAKLENNEILQPIDKIYFVICNSCYWCASYFGIDDLESVSGSSSHVLDCPICNSHNTELMPISTDESFRIEYSLTRGMEIEFYKSNKVVPRQQSVNEQYVNTLVGPG
jgi:Zn finger protein HypA/HybF involved in hydrogenase expression